MVEQHKAAARRIRLFLRDFRMLEATVSLADGQSLTSYLTSRKNYVNLRGAHWAGAQDDVNHAVLRVDQVLWAAAPDNDIALVNTSAALKPREVEIQLEAGLLVRGGLQMTETQRLSDYLEAVGLFFPLHDAKLLRSGRPPKKVNVYLGDVALNQSAIQAVWEVAVQATADTDARAPIADVGSMLE